MEDWKKTHIYINIASSLQLYKVNTVFILDDGTQLEQVSFHPELYWASNVGLALVCVECL